jgi:hypothetical protein
MKYKTRAEAVLFCLRNEQHQQQCVAPVSSVVLLRNVFGSVWLVLVLFHFLFTIREVAILKTGLLMK